MRRGLLAGAAALAIVSMGAADAAKPAMDGKALEAAFDAQIKASDLDAWMKQMASEPNHVGSPHDKANAEFMLAQFKAWGWDAHIEVFNVLYPTPISTTVELVAPTPVKLGGQEPPIEGDATSAAAITAHALPPYVAFQGDGDVTGEVVYVNYGMPDDYKALERRGVSVKGKIAIARYGGGWRGLKPKLAQEHGAIGCIIYSDPKDDGFSQSDAYPKGGARPAGGVQRGSVADMTTYPGDPLTPGIGATADAKRLKREDAVTILKIPVLPMSYGDAEKILGQLGGPVAPEGWRGGLGITYHMGGEGPVRLHLAVKSDWSLKPVYDVIAVMKGSEAPDQWIVRGNHHDGWVFGASDPLSGNVALMAEAKAFGALAKTGWRPKRTLVYASWDAEEPMLLGSTEWAETHAAELQQKGVVYINTDGNGRGFLGAQGSHEWQHLINAVARDVTDPETGATAYKRQAAGLLAGAYDKQPGLNEAAVKAAEKGDDLPIGPLGSGSDYSSFLQHLGVAAINIGYGGEDESDGTYHSVYDSYDHYRRFDDPGFKYGVALAQTVGRLVLRTADADTPPVRYGDFAGTVGTYLDEVKKLADSKREQSEKLARLRGEDAFRLASDPLKPVTAPEVEDAVPHFNFAALEDAVGHLKRAAKAYDDAYADKGAKLSPAARARLNGLLLTIDQTLLDERGLPGRPWYRNMIYAPGRFTGYGAKTLPGVREAIEERRWADADAYAGYTAKAIEAYAARLDQATGVISGS